MVVQIKGTCLSGLEEGVELVPQGLVFLGRPPEGGGDEDVALVSGAASVLLPVRPGGLAGGNALKGLLQAVHTLQPQGPVVAKGHLLSCPLADESHALTPFSSARAAFRVWRAASAGLMGSGP